MIKYTLILTNIKNHRKLCLSIFFPNFLYCTISQFTIPTQKNYIALKCLHCHGYEICKKYGDIEKAHLCNGPVKK